MRFVRRSLAVWALLVVGLTLGPVVLGYLAAWVSLRRAEKAWATRVEPMESFIARYPTEPDSPAVLALDEKTRALGIRMIRRPGEERREGPHDELLNELSSFISGGEGSEADELVPLPPAAVALLQSERARVEAIETQIRGAEAALGAGRHEGCGFTDPQFARPTTGARTVASPKFIGDCFSARAGRGPSMGIRGSSRGLRRL
jgi:hypothetical protein